MTSAALILPVASLELCSSFEVASTRLRIAERGVSAVINLVALVTVLVTTAATSSFCAVVRGVVDFANAPTTFAILVIAFVLASELTLLPPAVDLAVPALSNAVFAAVRVVSACVAVKVPAVI